MGSFRVLGTTLSSSAPNSGRRFAHGAPPRAVRDGDLEDRRDLTRRRARGAHAASPPSKANSLILFNYFYTGQGPVN
jgi:hypothetical protein